jgi:hypothetical protein
MRDPNLDFPPSPYREKIEARLCVDPYPDDLEAWTCDQAAQVLSSIDPHAFNEDAANYFQHFSEILESCLIAGEIDTFELEGKKYLKPLAVLEWGIARAQNLDYKLPGHVTYLYEEKLNQLNQASSSAKSDKTKATPSSSSDFEFSGLLNIPAKKDSWFDVIEDMTKSFYSQFNKIPNEAQAWAQLYKNPPEGYEITSAKDKGEDCLNMSGVKLLSKSAFSKRWAKYTADKAQ